MCMPQQQYMDYKSTIWNSRIIIHKLNNQHTCVSFIWYDFHFEWLYLPRKINTISDNTLNSRARVVAKEIWLGIKNTLNVNTLNSKEKVVAKENQTTCINVSLTHLYPQNSQFTSFTNYECGMWCPRQLQNKLK